MRNHIRVVIDIKENEDIKSIVKEKGWNLVDKTDMWGELTNLDMMVRNLLEIKHNHEEYKDDEDVYWWKDEYGSSNTWQIGCHPVFKDGSPCLNKERNVEYKACGWDENCEECKAKWLMEVYE